jgi:hypothetical protein
LERARKHRAAAERARRLARSIMTDDIVYELGRYASDLEAMAHDVEERACLLAETIAKTRSLGADIRTLIRDARDRLSALRSMKPAE